MQLFNLMRTSLRFLAKDLNQTNRLKAFHNWWYVIRYWRPDITIINSLGLSSTKPDNYLCGVCWCLVSVTQINALSLSFLFIDNREVLSLKFQTQKRPKSWRSTHSQLAGGTYKRFQKFLTHRKHKSLSLWISGSKRPKVEKAGVHGLTNYTYIRAGAPLCKTVQLHGPTILGPGMHCTNARQRCCPFCSVSGTENGPI